MVSQAKQIANQLNASKSTGPRSDEGKARSSRNRLRHGFFSAAVVLEGEDRAAYDALLDELVVEHHPLGASEMLCVQRVVDCTWKLWRVERSASEVHERRAMAVRKEAARWVTDATDALRSGRPIRDNWHSLYGADKPQLLKTAARYEQMIAHTPADATLAASMVDSRHAPGGAGEFERLQRYEQRLQNMLHRALSEPRKLRKERTEIGELPESPYARPSTDQSDDREPDQNTLHDAGADPPTGSPSMTLSPPASQNVPERAIANQKLRNEPTAREKEVTERRPQSSG